MRVLTLEYHDVLDGTPFDQSGFAGGDADSYKMSLTTFEEHLTRVSSVKSAGADVRTITQESRENHVILTFDDGGRSALGVTAPALQRRGMVGHFFMTTSQIGQPTFLSATELRELAGMGHVVGSHSHTHPVRMARLSDAELDNEWSTSRAILEDTLGEKITVASVPGGYFSPRVSAAAARAGIEWLFTSEPVTRVEIHGSCRILGRYTLRRNSPAQTVSSLLSPLGTARSQQWFLWNAKKLVKNVAGDSYLRVRQKLLRD